MIYYCILIVAAYLVYTLTFNQEKRMVRRTNNSIKRQKREYEKIDKVYQAKQQLKNRKLLDIVVRTKLMSEERLQSTLKELKLSGEKDPIKYIMDYFTIILVMAVSGTMFMLLSIFITKVAEVPVFGMIVQLFGLTLFASGIFQLFTVSSLASKKRAANVKEVEGDYNKLLTHLYYYYGTAGGKYMLSDVLGKFNTTIHPSTKAMIDGIIEDCKKSEIQALENVKIRYYQSLKLVNLADKLERCIDGFELGPVYIKSLHDQMIAEEDASRENKEQVKNEVYTVIMCVCMITVMLLQIIGIGTTFMKGGDF